MARYKAEPSSPTHSQRIDGQQWNVGTGGGTIKGWGYPTAAPSYQFTRYDANARSLDQHFNDLPLVDQEAWNHKAHENEDWIICILIRQYYQYYGG